MPQMYKILSDAHKVMHASAKSKSCSSPSHMEAANAIVFIGCAESTKGLGTYGRIRPLVMQLPPVEQLLSGILWEFPLFLLLGKLLPEAAQITAVLPQKLVLQLSVLGRCIELGEFSFSPTPILVVFRWTNPKLVICMITEYKLQINLIRSEWLHCRFMIS